MTMTESKKTYRFHSAIAPAGLMNEWSQQDIAREPMLFDNDADGAWKNGGPITRNFLECVGKTLKVENCIIDTRTHMLKPGWWPAIPGWHHDDIPRSRSDEQPNYDTPEYRSHHALAVVNSDICPTEFLLGDIEVPAVPLGKIIYGKWHNYLEGGFIVDTKNSGPHIERVQDRRVTFFDWQTFHQAQKANASGWRWFGRVTWRTPWKPFRAATNQVRKQVQVYMEMPNAGW